MPTSQSAPMIFISYRRDDSGGHVGRLYDALSAHFGRERLFYDIDHIAPGQDFVRVLEDSLNRCSVLLVVIGKRWAGSGRIGSRRIDDEGDFVRLEVAAGLRRPELRVIPVLIQGAKMPSAASLPEPLRDLSRRNAFDLSDLRWRDDVARLMASMESEMGVPTAATTPIAVPAWARAPLSRARALPRPARWGSIVVAALLLALLIRTAVAHHAPAANASTTSEATLASAGSVAPLAEVPHAEPPKIPAHLGAVARSSRVAARKWRDDAVLSQVEASLPSDTADARAYQVTFDFRSPSDGAGLSVITGTSAQPRYVKLPPGGRASTRALPDSFVDLPEALATAREAGMFGALRDARLSTSGSRALWTLKPSASDQYRVYYVDAVTGKIASAPQQQHRGGLVGKVKSIFH